jgi:hypothetical protein
LNGDILGKVSRQELTVIAYKKSEHGYLDWFEILS